MKGRFQNKNYTSRRLVIIVLCFANAWKTTKMLVFSVKAYKIKNSDYKLNSNSALATIKQQKSIIKVYLNYSFLVFFDYRKMTKQIK